MKEITFLRGGAYRVVVIKERVVSLMAPELYNQPISVNLDKIEEEEDKIKKAKIPKKELEKLRMLDTEDEIAEDIIKDFQKDGWRVTQYGVC